MSESQPYGFIPREFYETPPEMMVGETVFDAAGEAVGWIVEPETCHMEPVKDYPVGKCAIFSFGCVCSACGSFFEYTRSSNWHFCPNCGRKVVSE